jgi:hypothetical protein
MANEVIIEEYADISIRTPIVTQWVTTQIKDIGTLSSQLNAATKYVRIISKGTGFWYTLGDSGASAAANTGGSSWIPADGVRDILVTSATHIDTAA